MPTRMATRTAASTVATAAVVAAATVGVPVPAGAAAPGSATSVASASLGTADLVVDGTPLRAGPIAACSVAGPATGSTSGVRVGDSTQYGRGESTCARAGDGTSSGTASGQRFETSLLEEYGGPVIRVRTYTAECRTTRNGSTGYVQLGGVSGFPLPADIPPNHVVTIPGAGQGDPPMARLVLNEFSAPEPPDGSLTTSALRITLFPEGGPVSGDIRVGTASCDPYGG